MIRRIAMIVCLFLFVSSSSFVAAEPLPSLEQDSQTSLWMDDGDSSSHANRPRRISKRSPRGKSLLESLMDDGDSSSDANRPRRISKRSPRGKSSLKSLLSLNRPPRAISFTRYLGETHLFSGLSKASVYQQINVYRI